MYIKLGDTEKFNKISENIDFQKGAERFRKIHNLEPKYPKTRKLIENEEKLKPKSVKYRWYKKIVTKKEWEKKYSKLDYIIVDITEKEIEFAYMSVFPVDDIPITDKNELKKIYNYLSVKNVKV